MELILLQFSAGLEELWSNKVKTIDFMVIGPVESELHISTGKTTRLGCLECFRWRFSSIMMSVHNNTVTLHWVWDGREGGGTMHAPPSLLLGCRRLLPCNYPAFIGYTCNWEERVTTPLAVTTNESTLTQALRARSRNFVLSRAGPQLHHSILANHTLAPSSSSISSSTADHTHKLQRLSLLRWAQTKAHSVQLRPGYLNFLQGFYMQVLGLITGQKRHWRTFVQHQYIVQSIYFQYILFVVTVCC